MKTRYSSFIKGLTTSTLLLTSIASFSQEKLWHLDSYVSGEGVGAAEIVSFDAPNKILYMINGATKTVDRLDAKDPNNLTKINTLDVSTIGAGSPTSVTVKNNTVAVAVPSATGTKGFVAFFNASTGAFVSKVEVGYLPDMVTFTHDGNYVLTANEGEPSADYTIDPEGSISIIDVSNGLTNLTAIDANFKAWIGKENHLRNKEIRIFGNDNKSNAAQDLEPEYITISEDNKIAYVVCQENNAIAVVDIVAGTVVDLLPLGLKDHSSGKAHLKTYILNELAANWPTLGTKHHDNKTVNLGGFSGLWYAHDESSANNLVFYTIPDRGPNAGAETKLPKYKSTETALQNVRPFLLPDYQARIVKFSLDTTKGTITLNDPISLTSYDGTTPISGRGNIEGTDEVPVAYYKEGTAYDKKDYYKLGENAGDTTFYHGLSYDAHGGDFEGIVKDKDGNFWMCDEYRPAIYKFDKDGKMIKRFIPKGMNGVDNSAYGDQMLPEVYNKRWANRGFEGICYDKQKNLIYAFIQSPMYNPSVATKHNSDVIRILAIDGTTGAPTHEYVYLLTNNADKAASSNRVDKIGDVFFTENGKILVVERDSDKTSKSGQKYIYEIDLTGATDILGTDLAKSMVSPTLEEQSADQLIAQSVQPVFKRRILNAPSIGYTVSDKIEGLVQLGNGSFAILNDNDFGLEGAGMTDNSVLGIIDFDKNNSFDASNKASGIDMQSWKTLGMYMPDAIASYNVNGMEYIVTANEGDARDYDGYSEEVRVKDLTYDANAYGAEVTDENLLSRLKTTTANGDLNNDGTYEYIYSYGARSFSIYDEKGNQVFDSNNEFEKTLAKDYGDFFNGQYDDETFEWKSAKNRSDDKGAEPEGLAIGELNGKKFAFVGLERMGGIMVYDITDPSQAKFVQYISTANYGKGNSETELKAGVAGDIAPEGLTFVKAEDSPTNYPLLFVAHEVSGTVAVFGLSTDKITSTQESVSINQSADFFAYPTNATNTLSLNKVSSGEIFNIEGKKVMAFDKKNELNISRLLKGFYIVKTQEGFTSLFRIIK